GGAGRVARAGPARQVGVGAGGAPADSGVLRQSAAPDGLPDVSGAGLADRVGAGGKRVQDGGGAAAERGGDALGRGGGGRGLPVAGAVPRGEGAVGRLLEPEVAPFLPTYKTLTGGGTRRCGTSWWPGAGRCAGASGRRPSSC